MRQRSRWWLGTLSVAFVVLAGSMPRGHTPIASRFNYNEHLFPIFRDRCGSCHIEGGVAPMSLVDYQSAYPWTQSIREEILGLRMPPWQAEDGFGDFRNGHVLPPHEMDMLLEWSSGGYPQGPRDQTPPVPDLTDGWTLGEPPLTLEMPEAFVIDAGTSETIRYFVIPSGVDEDRILTGVEFRPGARAVVRGAAVFVDASGVARALDEADAATGFAQRDGLGFPTVPPVAVWTPGQQAVLNVGVGYALPREADIVVRVHYKKTWITEGSEFSDQSQIGLHFADGDAANIESVLVTSPPEVDGQEVIVRHQFDEESTILALLPEVDIESSDLQVEAITPDGTRIPMLWLREPDTGWPTRFWFESPITLPAGTRLEVTTLLAPAAERSPHGTLLGDETGPIRFSVAYVRGSLPAN